MLALPPVPGTPDHTIYLSDASFEDSQTVRTFLSLFVKIRLDFDFDERGKYAEDNNEDEEGAGEEDDGNAQDNAGEAEEAAEKAHNFDGYQRWRPRLLKFISFLDKYSSERGLELLRTVVSQVFVDDRFGDDGDAFMVGAVTGNPGMCALAVRDNYGTWRGGAEGDPLGSRNGAVLSLFNLPYEYLCMIPPQFQFALVRAQAMAKPGTRQFARTFAKTVKATLAAKGEFSSARFANREGPEYEPIPASLPTLNRGSPS